jgi:predicted ATPase/class 3 adenylate cyclase
MSAALRPFVPDQLVRMLEEHPSAMPIAAASYDDAVVLFADIAGFTPMSQALAASGKYGAEELNRILNDYFGAMIEKITYYGGSVAKFTGDALTALFAYDRSTRTATARQAVRCALDMQAAMSAFQALGTRAGDFGLAMRVGLADGRVLSTIVGDPAVRLQYVIAGKVLDRAAAAERMAATGEVLVDDWLLDGLDDIEIVGHRGRARVAARLRRPISLAPSLRPRPDDRAATDRLEPFLHPAVAERLRAGRRGLVNEHRKVTVAFVGFPDFDEGDPGATAALQAYLTAVIQTVDQYGGNLDQVDVGDKGSVLMICFGAPVSHEDDEQRAIECCLTLLGLPGGPFRAGVATDFVYCGLVGSGVRRAYTTVGDSVNLAARLLQAAQPGQLLVDRHTHDRVANTTVSDRLEQITVKGRDGPITVWAVKAARERPGLRLLEPTSVAPLVGRAEETRTIRSLVQDVRQGRGHVLGLVGEPGIGKSRLASEAVDLAELHGFAVYGGACRSFGATTGYLVWRSIWQGLFGIDDTLPVAEQQAQLMERLVASGLDSGQRAPLLGPMLNLPMPDSELTASLDPQARAELLQSLLLEYLRRQAAAGPLLLVLEDCHWIDAASLNLLEFLARNLVELSVLMVVVARTHVATITSPLASLRRLARFTEVQVGDLPASDAVELARQRLQHRYGSPRELSDAVVHRVAEHANGNPFYIEELVGFLHARGVDPSDASAFAGLELPDSLQRLVLARLDQLTETEKATLKIASVIGRVFRGRWLWGSYPEVGNAEAVTVALEHLDALGLTPLRSTLPEPEYGFKHAIIQEVAYDSLAFSTRESLHERVAAFVEQAYADRLDQYMDVLAYHYGRTDNGEKQRVWFRAAADRAKAAFANEAAVDYYQRLLPLLPEDRTAEVLVQLGTVWHLIGRWTEAEQAYHQAMKLALRAREHAVVAASRRQLGMLVMFTKSYPEAIGWLEQAAAEFERLGDPRGLAMSLDRLAFAHIQQGAPSRALAASERHLAIATAADDLAGVGAAYHNLGLIHWDSGAQAEALAFFERALDALAKAGDQRGLISATNDLGGLHMERGDQDTAFRHLRDALSLAEGIGDRWMSNACINNLGELYRERGDYAWATRCYGYAIRIALELGDTRLVTIPLANLGIIDSALGKDEAAERLLARAIDLARTLDDSLSLCEYLHHQAELCARQGHLEEAERTNQETLSLAARTTMQLPATLLSIRLQVARGRLNKHAAIEQLGALRDSSPDAASQASTLRAIWQLDPTHEAARKAAAAHYRSLYEQSPAVGYRDAYEELTGVTLPPAPALPPLPGPVSREAPDVEVLLGRLDLVASQREPSAVG